VLQEEPSADTVAGMSKLIKDKKVVEAGGREGGFLMQPQTVEKKGKSPEFLPTGEKGIQFRNYGLRASECSSVEKRFGGKNRALNAKKKGEVKLTEKTPASSCSDHKKGKGRHKSAKKRRRMGIALGKSPKGATEHFSVPPVSGRGKKKWGGGGGEDNCWTRRSLQTPTSWWDRGWEGQVEGKKERP